VNEIQKLEVTGTLDLHHFQPKEIVPLIDEFLNECLENSILEGRIIHGKGIGTQRAIVQNHLKKHHLIEKFWNGNQDSGGWGSTGFKLSQLTPAVD
tara:strand:+ start:800 stop:1087 length:288 start_codon:yes stop_codon:yes gene_type:complete